MTSAYHPLPLLVVAALSIAAACKNGKGKAPDGSAPPACDEGRIPTTLAEEDGLMQLSVEQPEGFSDTIWVYVASPPGDGPWDVVVYGRGQGQANIVNCNPDRPGYIPRGEVDAIAGLGYIGVGIAYRDDGKGSPGTGTMKHRDHYLWDTRAFLAVAAWASRHVAGASGRTALLGTSMGTYPATWATVPREETADLAACVDLRSIILAGGSANHLANVSQIPLAVAAGLDADAVFSGIHFVLAGHVMGLRLPTVSAAEVGDQAGELGSALAASLTPRGVVAVETLFLAAADPALAGCEQVRPGLPPACDSQYSSFEDSCQTATLLQVWDAEPSQPGEDPAALQAWLTDTSIAAFEYWSPGEARTDPGPASGNLLIDIGRAFSAPYDASVVTARAPMALAILSVNDPHWDAAALGMLIDRLEAIGASVDAPSIEADGGHACKHADYLAPSYPACGLTQIAEHLAKAFGED